MPCFMVMDGIKQEIDDDLFEQMSEELHRPKTLNSKWKPDGTYDKTPLDPDYFKNYFQANLKTPIKCPWLWKSNNQQIKPIKTPQHQHL